MRLKTSRSAATLRLATRYERHVLRVHGDIRAAAVGSFVGDALGQSFPVYTKRSELTA